MEIEIRDILSINHGIICHQVNCRGVMGTGLALAIRRKWPIVYREYKKIANPNMLGEIQIVSIETELFIVNMFCQDRYGKNARYTDYKAVDSAFSKLKEWHKQYYKELNIYVPFMMGCGYGGGDWEIYSSIISKHIPNAIVCKRS